MSAPQSISPLRPQRLAADSGQRATELTALHDAIRFGDRDSLPRVIEVASGVYGRLAPVIAAHAQALIDNDAGAIYSAAKEFEEIGSLLSAADAAAAGRGGVRGER